MHQRRIFEPLERREVDTVSVLRVPQERCQCAGVPDEQQAARRRTDSLVLQMLARVAVADDELLFGSAE